MIKIARTGYPVHRNEVYNKQKKKHALKFRTTSSLDGLLLHFERAIKEFVYDWALFLRSGTAEQLDATYLVNGVQHYMLGDSGYNSL